MTFLKHTLTVAAVAIFTLSFTTLVTSKKEVDTTKSKVTWKGYKVTGSHEGTINIKSAHLTFETDVLTGGEFVMDMPTITVTDISGKGKGKLEGHLKSDDFFGVKNFPEAKLVFTNVKATSKNAYDITGDIMIKGKTETITFSLSVYGNKASAALKLDRTKFGVKYGSNSFFDGLKDKAIYDEFDLVADLVF